jgi:hypothetical protein
MSKVYQPIVIEETENLIEGLIESDFFKDYEITNYTYARQYLLDVMTQKYIDGSLDDLEREIFDEDEFTKILQEIVAGTVLYELKEMGLLESYEDENTEEMFFLTEKGKEHLKNDEENRV